MVPELFSKLDQPFTGEVLFDHLHDVVFFVKNDTGQYVVVNQTLVGRCGRKKKSELLGHTPSQLLRRPLGQRFEDQDRRVLATGQPLVSQLELHIYASLETGWCLTTKLPLRSPRGKIVGLVGVSQDLKLPDVNAEEFQHLAKATAYAAAHLSSGLSVMDLAKAAKMSRYQLDRRMRRVFGLTTGQWLIKSRIDQAKDRLRDSQSSIASIALEVGYSDQSAFTRQFRQVVGISPRDFRVSSRGE